MAPRITVLTPTFNRAPFLPETIESILEQDYAAFDHLVLDDGSTDGTAELLESYARARPGQFRYVRHENVGQARTLNRGFALADGEFLCIVNSEDPLLPGALKRLAAELVTDHSLVGVYPDFRVIDADGKTEVELLLPSHSLVELFRLQMSFGPGVLFSKRMANDIGGWNPNYRIVPDLEFFLRACLYGKFAHVPEVLATWRRHQGAITVMERGGSFASEERFRLLEEFLARPDLPDELSVRRLEAYSNLHIITALELLPELNRPEDRFAIFDRVGWNLSSHTVGLSLEAELLHFKNAASVLQQELLHFKNATSILQQEVEWRDRELASQRQKIAGLTQELKRSEATLAGGRQAPASGEAEPAE